MARTPEDLPYPGLDLEAVREYAREYVNRTSLRQAGARIGIRYNTLSKFLEGSVPHARVRGVLGAWFLRETAPAAMRAREQASHLDGLVMDLAGYAREETQAAIVAALDRGYALQGLPAPAWLRTEDQSGYAI